MKKKKPESTADVHPKIGKTIISDVLYNVLQTHYISFTNWTDY